MTFYLLWHEKRKKKYKNNKKNKTKKKTTKTKWLPENLHSFYITTIVVI